MLKKIAKSVLFDIVIPWIISATFIAFFAVGIFNFGLFFLIIIWPTLFGIFLLVCVSRHPHIKET